jgi:PAS domain S-box-containing protein
MGNPQKDEVEEGGSETVGDSRLHVIWDRGFRVLRWSRWAERVFGWTEEEVRGKKPCEWAFIHEDDREEVERAIDRLASGEVVRQVVRWRHRTREGHALACDWYHYVRGNTGKEPIRVESLVRPVSDGS